MFVRQRETRTTNLFQSGPRYRGDISYSSASFSIFAADLWRARGDLILPIIDAFDGQFLRDTTFAVGWQNLAIGGFSGVVNVSRNFSIVPTGTFKTVVREDKTGRGWLASGGLTFPSRIGLMEFFPAVKVNRGKLAPAATPFEMQDFWGMEMSFVMRLSTVRLRKSRGRA